MRNLQSLSWSRNTLPLTEPEGSLPCLQQRSTSPYPELDEPSRRTRTLSS